MRFTESVFLDLFLGSTITLAVTITGQMNLPDESINPEIGLSFTVPITMFLLVFGNRRLFLLSFVVLLWNII